MGEVARTWAALPGAIGFGHALAAPGQRIGVRVLEAGRIEPATKPLIASRSSDLAHIARPSGSEGYCPMIRLTARPCDAGRGDLRERAETSLRIVDRTTQPVSGPSALQARSVGSSHRLPAKTRMPITPVCSQRSAPARERRPPAPRDPCSGPRRWRGRAPLGRAAVAPPRRDRPGGRTRRAARRRSPR
jgi:hypothetical protein